MTPYPPGPRAAKSARFSSTPLDGKINGIFYMKCYCKSSKPRESANV